MGGIFGVVSNEDCVLEVFFGTDYHSHLGARRGGMAFYGPEGFNRAIHNIENTPFRTKFESEAAYMKGNIGIGCISDTEPQPLLVRSHLGSYAITTVGRINNIDELTETALAGSNVHFLELSGGVVNPTEVAAALINTCDTLEEGIRHAQDMIKGSLTLLVMNREGIYAARDRYGRTPLVIGSKEGSYCASFESFAYLNLGFEHERELGPGEIVYLTRDGIEVMTPPFDKLSICGFLWIYFGYPTSNYEGMNVELVRMRCGANMADRDHEVKADLVAGVPDSGIAHAIGYANRSGIPFARPFIKYTPTWPRSFLPNEQRLRNLIARMKIISVDALIRGKSLLLIDDSIVRGTQLRETTEFLYHSGAKEVHVRPACPPLLYGCPYLNFSRSTSDLDLITRRIIQQREGDNPSAATLTDYADPDSKNYREMLAEIRNKLKFTSLSYNRMDDMLDAIGIDPNKVCTYCWNGKG